jgi:hypothetical protein
MAASTTTSKSTVTKTVTDQGTPVIEISSRRTPAGKVPAAPAKPAQPKPAPAKPDQPKPEPKTPKPPVTTSSNPALAGRPPRTTFYRTVITKAMTVPEIEKALAGAGWPDEGTPKVVATLGYLVKTKKLVAGKRGEDETYAPAK